MDLSGDNRMCIQHTLLTRHTSLTSAHSLGSVCSCAFGSQPSLMLPFLHPETVLRFGGATFVLPSQAVVAVSRHERGSYPPETNNNMEHPSTL